MLQSVIIGFGHAGKHLHLPCIKKLWQRNNSFNADQKAQPIYVVDPYAKIDTADEDKYNIRFYRDLKEIRELVPKQTVVHICTPPNNRVDVLEQAASLGFQQFIIEKPMATSKEDIAQILRLQEYYSLDILVVLNWASSTLTGVILKYLQNYIREVKVEKLTIRQVKPRLSWTLANSSHGTVFDVEVPHMVGLSLLVGGTRSSLLRAYCTDMQVVGKTIANMGTADIVLRMENGSYAYLHSDLTAPWRERSIRIDLSDGTYLCGYYPCDSSDMYSQLHFFDYDGSLINRTSYQDDTLTNFLLQAYHYFEFGSPQPHSTVAFNVSVCSIVAAAKSLCGIQDSILTTA